MKNNLWRKLVCFIGIVIFTLTLKAQSYEIINESGIDISKVYVSVSGSGTWSNNVLMRDRALNGESFTIALPYTTDCYYDIKYLATDGKEYTLSRLRMCDNANITLIPARRIVRPGVTD